jgi:hypothetical protein
VEIGVVWHAAGYGSTSTAAPGIDVDGGVVRGFVFDDDGG